MSPVASIWKRACLVLAALLLVWLLFAWCCDFASVDDADLAFVEREVDPSRNPYPEIRNLEWTDEEKEEFRRVSAMLAGRESIDLPFLEGMLQRHAPALERFSRYAAMDDWQSDKPDGRNTSAPHVSNWHLLASLKRVEAASLTARGESRAALEKAVSLLDFSSGLGRVRDPGVHVFFTVYLSMDGRKCLLGLLEHHRFDRETLAWLASRLEEPNLSRDDLGAVLRTAYPHGEALLAELEESSKARQLDDQWRYVTPEWLPHRLLFKRNRTRAMLADIHRAAIQASRRNAKEVGDSVYAAIPRDARARWAQRLSGNWLGFEFVDNHQGTLVRIFVNRYRLTQANLHLLRVRVAMERHRLDHGAWPDNLGELVSPYLDDLPLDPFDGRPLRYDTARRVIYSIGGDLRDNGGVFTGDLAWPNENEDIAIELESEKPTPWPEFPPP